MLVLGCCNVDLLYNIAEFILSMYQAITAPHCKTPDTAISLVIAPQFMSVKVASIWLLAFWSSLEAAKAHLMRRRRIQQTI